jgi:ABC-type xylose transport system substrate-binding protein
MSDNEATAINQDSLEETETKHDRWLRESALTEAAKILTLNYNQYASADAVIATARQFSNFIRNG